MKCPESGKHFHASRGAAEAQLRSVEKMDRAHGEAYVYPCVACCGWHIGRRKKNAHVSKYQKVTKCQN